MPVKNAIDQTLKEPAEISPAKGKLGIMIPGMGAVATTFVAGVEAVRKGISSPIGSLTQMGTIRLGKRTESRSPKIKDFVPLAALNDLVFTGWDIFEDDMYSAAGKAPLTNLLLVGSVALAPWIGVDAVMFGIYNFLLGLYNLLPIPSSDGRRILNLLVQHQTRDAV